MADRHRWEKAQHYEQSWWDTRKANLDLSYFKSFADELQSFLPTGTVKASTSILEIGSGPAGILTHLDSNDKHAIDPLESFYATVDSFVRVRDSRTHYYTVRGEELPFPDNRFDLIIMDNVLDHAQDPMQVLREMQRVIKPNGLVFFRQNVYHVWGLSARWLMERFVLDPGHPHTFTSSSLKQALTSLGFGIEREKRRGYVRTWWQELRSGNRKALVRAMLFVTRDKVTYALRAPR